MSRSRIPLLAASGAVAAAALVTPAAAGAPDSPSLKGLVLTGICPGQLGDLKSVVATPKSKRLWAPIPLLSTDFTPLRKSLKPFEIEVSGNGLKTRHLGPGDGYTRPGGRMPKHPVTCVFEGVINKEDGPFQISITGKVKGR